MKLILVRHGETEENKNGILQGHLPGKLTKLGIEQSKKLALRLKDEKIDAIYSSDLARASDTAKEIAKYHQDAPLYFVDKLREKDQGSLTGKLIKEVDWDAPRDTEKKESIAERAKLILDKVYKKYKGKTVLFVSHGMFIKILTTMLMNKPLDKFKEIGFLVNTSVNIFEIKEDNNHNIILINCGKHLD
jgi:broad specificity phosphatase PhoE